MGAVAELSDEGRGLYRLSGDVGFSTVGGLIAQGRLYFSQAGEAIEVDLDGVNRIDSAGLALLLEWMRVAQGAGRTIRYRRLPEQLRAIARASNLVTHLPVID